MRTNKPEAIYQWIYHKYQLDKCYHYIVIIAMENVFIQTKYQDDMFMKHHYSDYYTKYKQYTKLNNQKIKPHNRQFEIDDRLYGFIILITIINASSFQWIYDLRNDCRCNIYVENVGSNNETKFEY